MRTLIVFLILFQGSLGLASFDSNARRYMSYYEVIASLREFFLGSTSLPTGVISSTCLVVDADNKADLGYNSPATGEPITAAPNSNYIRWMSTCVGSYMSYLKMSSIKDSRLLSETTKKELFKTIDPNALLVWLDITEYNSLPESVKNDLVEFTFNLVFGPDDVFNQFGLMDAKLYRAKIRNHLDAQKYTVFKALSVIMLNYLNRDEFLSY